MKQFLLLLLLSSCLETFAIRARMRPIECGANQYEFYEPTLKGKRIALLVNQTSVVNGTHLVDFLLENKVKIVKIFGPEHGFRGTGDAGEHVSNGIDQKTKLPVISLYGSNKKPTKEQLKDIDIVVFDIQDVGARFYTFISTLQYMMEACAENKKTLLILDRPNPNGFYVDGPVLETAQKSFVGMQPIPIIHGMTVGEYAKMLNGEGWLAKKVKCKLEVITCRNYGHHMRYTLPIAPSPNLNSQIAIYLYPSLCLFEGTEVSVGRGTEHPFTLWGHPDFKKMPYQFTPKSMPGAKTPPQQNKTCYGVNYFEKSEPEITEEILEQQFNIKFIKEAYQNAINKNTFFLSTGFFEKLAGNSLLRKQIINNVSDEEIRKSWEPALGKFKKTRKKYLLYGDFM
jgi:uncharacterized protein YbbC (DUF1343 family)